MSFRLKCESGAASHLESAIDSVFLFLNDLVSHMQARVHAHTQANTHTHTQKGASLIPQSVRFNGVSEAQMELRQLLGLFYPCCAWVFVLRRTQMSSY